MMKNSAYKITLKKNLGARAVVGLFAGERGVRRGSAGARVFNFSECDSLFPEETKRLFVQPIFVSQKRRCVGVP